MTPSKDDEIIRALVNVDTPRTTQNILSVCSGVGGLDLGVGLALRDSRVVCYVEREAFAVETLVRHMEEGRLDPAPVWTDLRSFDGGMWRDLVDGIVGGYPCQPFSVAGKQRGKEDERHLWPHIAEIIAAARPAWCFFENVAGHLRLGFDDVRRDLHRLGYRVAAGLFSAEEVGASHKRERLFILAMADCYADGFGRQRDHRELLEGERQAFGSDIDGCGDETMADAGQSRLIGRGSASTPRGERLGAPRPEPSPAGVSERGGGAAMGDSQRTERRQSDAQRGCSIEGDDRPREAAGGSGIAGSELGDSHLPRPQGLGEPIPFGTDEFAPWPPGPEDYDGWEFVLLTEGVGRLPALPQSGVRGVADGAPSRVDQLRALGNGVVPLQAAYAFAVLHAALTTDSD